MKTLTQKMSMAVAILTLATTSMLATSIEARADQDHDYQGSVGLKDVNQATDIALRAIELVDQLQSSSDYAELGNYLLPIKKAAAHAYALGRSHGEFSLELRNSMIVLKNAIAKAGPFIEDQFERSDSFDTATELLTLQDQIEAVL